MVQLAFDASGFGAMCAGLAAIITAMATLVWACRRDPKGGGGNDGVGSGQTRLPPAE